VEVSGATAWLGASGAVSVGTTTAAVGAVGTAVVTAVVEEFEVTRRRSDRREFRRRVGRATFGPGTSSACSRGAAVLTVPREVIS
jgi:hypothetical protein